MNPLVFAVVLPTLLVAHNVADHWVQTGHQACRKGDPGWPGRLACARHVATYTAFTAVMVGAVWWLFALPIGLWWFVAGQVVSAVTHYWADRRFTLEALAKWGIFGRIGIGDFYRLGMPRDVSATVLVQTSAESPWGWIASSTCTATNPSPVPRIRVDLADKYGRVTWDSPSLGTGAYVLDQSWHWAWLFVAALLTALV